MNATAPPIAADAGSEPAAPAAVDQRIGLLHAIAHHYLLVLVTAGLSLGIAFGTIVQREATYESTASVIVKPMPQDTTFIGIRTVIDSMDPGRTIQTAATLVRAASAADAAAKAMGRGWTRARVENAVDVAPRGESFMLAITAKAPTASAAAKLANAYATAALNARAKIVRRHLQATIRALDDRLIMLRQADADARQIGGLQSRQEELRALRALGRDPSLQLSQRAEPPMLPVDTSRVRVLVLVLLGGLLLGGIAALALEFFSQRIRREDEIARLYPIPILAGIPNIRGKRGRAKPNTLPSDAFEPVRLLRAQLPVGEHSTSIVLTSADSGDGKTTTAAAVATALALDDQDVILMDLDTRKGGDSSMFGIARPLIVSQNAATFERRLAPVLDLPRLRVMPAPLVDPIEFEQFLKRLPDMLAEAKRAARWVIVDTPPLAEVSDALQVARACDHVLLVVRPRHTNRARFIATRDILTRAGIRPIGSVIVGQRIARSRQRYYDYDEVRAMDLQGGRALTPDEPWQRSRPSPAAEKAPVWSRSVPAIPAPIIVVAVMLAALVAGRLFATGANQIALAIVIAAFYLPLVFLDFRIALALWAGMLYIAHLPQLSIAPNATAILLVVGWLAGGIVAKSVRLPVLAQHRRLVATVVLFAVWLGLSRFWTEDPGLTDTETRYWAGPLLFVIVAMTLVSTGHVRLVAAGMVGGAVASVLLGLFGGSLATSGATAVTIAEGRLTGGGGDPNVQAAGYVVAVALAGGLLSGVRQPERRIALMASMALITFGVFATLSRGGLVALGCAALVAFIVTPRYRFAILGIIAIAGAGLAIFLSTHHHAMDRLLQPDGGAGRVDIWNVAWRVFQDHPVLGIGLNSFTDISPRYVLEPGPLKNVRLIAESPHIVHNAYLQLLVENGVIGLALFVFVVGACLRSSWLAARHFDAIGEPRQANLARAVLVAAAGMLGANVFVSNSFDFRLWIVLALGPVMLTIARRDSLDAPRPPILHPPPQAPLAQIVARAGAAEARATSAHHEQR